MPETSRNLDAVLALIARTPVQPGRRRLIGIAGPPGSGKTTLAAAVVEHLDAAQPGTAVLLPMDGFHLDNDALDRAGLRAVKGAPHTFDVAGFVAKVREIGRAGVPCRFPRFDRTRDCTLPDAGLAGPEAQIVVVEGNYLLLREGEWSALRDLFDATVMLAPPENVLEGRLLQRWLDHGLTPNDAAERARGNDLVNARRVLAGSARPDLLLADAPGPGPARAPSP